MGLNMHGVTAPEEEALYFDNLEAVLEAHNRLALYLLPDRGILSLLALDEQRKAHLKVAQQFTPSELSLLRPLLSHYPHHCPHEVMFASFSQNTTAEEVVAHTRLRLQKAIEDGTWDHEMRPLRNVLSRMRLKLKDFGLDVLSILETGYLLLPSQSKKKPKQF